MAEPVAASLKETGAHIRRRQAKNAIRDWMISRFEIPYDIHLVTIALRISGSVATTRKAMAPHFKE
jgi:hypothetical protein